MHCKNTVSTLSMIGLNVLLLKWQLSSKPIDIVLYTSYQKQFCKLTLKNRTLLHFFCVFTNFLQISLESLHYDRFCDDPGDDTALTVEVDSWTIELRVTGRMNKYCNCPSVRVRSLSECFLMNVNMEIKIEVLKSIQKDLESTFLQKNINYLTRIYCIFWCCDESNRNLLIFGLWKLSHHSIMCWSGVVQIRDPFFF